METGLCATMTHFEISGKKLAEVCDVSSSFISQLKNGTQSLYYYSSHCEKISNYVYDNYFSKHIDSNISWLNKEFKKRYKDGDPKIYIDFNKPDLDIVSFLKIFISYETYIQNKSSVNINNIYDTGDASHISNLISSEIDRTDPSSSVYICIMGSGIENSDSIKQKILAIANKFKDVLILMSKSLETSLKHNFFLKYLDILTRSNVRLFETDNLISGFYPELLIITPAAVIVVLQANDNVYFGCVIKQKDFIENSIAKYGSDLKSSNRIINFTNDIKPRVFDNNRRRAYNNLNNFLYSKQSLLNPLFMSEEIFTKWLGLSRFSKESDRIKLFSQRKQAFNAFMDAKNKKKKPKNIYLEYNLFNLNTTFSDTSYVQTDDLFSDPNPPAFVVQDIIKGYIEFLHKYNNFHVRFYPPNQNNGGFLPKYETAFISESVFSAIGADGTRLYSENSALASAAQHSFDAFWKNMVFVDGESNRNAVTELEKFLEKHIDLYNKLESQYSETGYFSPFKIITGTYNAEIINGCYLLNEAWLKITEYCNYFTSFDKSTDFFEIIFCDENKGLPFPDGDLIPLTDLPSPEDYRFALGCGKKIILCKNYEPFSDSYFNQLISSSSSSDKRQITSVPSDKFSYKTDLTELYFPDYEISILQRAFSYCTSLKTVRFSPFTYYIDSEAFSNCISLEEVEVPKNTGFLGSGIFMNCISLKKAVFKTSYSVPSLCFLGCSDLVIIDISPDCQYINESAFSGCVSLNRINLPGSLREIGNYAFENTSFKELVLPNGLFKIGDGAFSNCVNLKRIEIPSSVKFIGSDVFSSCEKLTIITPRNSEAWFYAVKNNILVSEY